MYRLFTQLNATIPPLLPLTWTKNVRHTVPHLSGISSHCLKCNKDKGLPMNSLLSLTFDVVQEEGILAIKLYPALGYHCDEKWHHALYGKNKTRVDIDSIDKVVQSVKKVIEGGTPTYSYCDIKKPKGKVMSQTLPPLETTIDTSKKVEYWSLQVEGKTWSPAQLTANAESMRVDYIHSIGQAGAGCCLVL